MCVPVLFDVAIRRHCRSCFPAAPAVVCLIVEFFEEEEEHDRVHSDPPHKRTGVITINKQQLEGMYHDSDELHLKR